MRLTDIAKAWLKASLKEGDIVIDATLGNGHDTFFLAENIGTTGTIYGFDIQEQAIQQTRERLRPFTCNKHLFLLNHDMIQNTLPSQAKGEVSTIMFNLGWLPGSDKSIITQTKSTLSALHQSLDYLSLDGKLSVMVYPGHSGGDHEASEVMTWLAKACADSKGRLSYEKVENIDRPTSPTLIKVVKHK